MPDFNLLNLPNFSQSALAGYQAGSAMRQQNERQGALEGYLADPENEVSVKRLALADSSLGLPIMERQRETKHKRRVGELAARASQGDREAAMELWREGETDIASKFDERTQGKLAEGKKVFGQVLLEVANAPPDQRPAIWDARARWLAENGFPDAEAYIGHYSEDNLNAGLAETGMTEKALTMGRERWTPVPQGASLVNTNDPEAIAEFNARSGGAGAPPQAPPASPDGRNTFAEAAQAGQLIQSMGAPGFLRWQQQNQVPVLVRTPEDMAALPVGTMVLSADGRTGVKR